MGLRARLPRFQLGVLGRALCDALRAGDRAASRRARRGGHRQRHGGAARGAARLRRRARRRGAGADADLHRAGQCGPLLRRMAGVHRCRSRHLADGRRAGRAFPARQLPGRAGEAGQPAQRTPGRRHSAGGRARSPGRHGSARRARQIARPEGGRGRDREPGQPLQGPPGRHAGRRVVPELQRQQADHHRRRRHAGRRRPVAARTAVLPDHAGEGRSARIRPQRDRVQLSPHQSAGRARLRPARAAGRLHREEARHRGPLPDRASASDEPGGSAVGARDLLAVHGAARPDRPARRAAPPRSAWHPDPAAVATDASEPGASAAPRRSADRSPRAFIGGRSACRRASGLPKPTSSA